MEPATADPSLLTDTATSDTTASVGTVVTTEIVINGAIVSVWAMVVGSVRAMDFSGYTNQCCKTVIYLLVNTSRMKESLTSGEV